VRNNPADAKVREGGVGGNPGTYWRGHSPIARGRDNGGAGNSQYPMERTILEQISTLQPVEDPTPGQVDMP